MLYMTQFMKCVKMKLDMVKHSYVYYKDILDKKIIDLKRKIEIDIDKDLANLQGLF